MILLLVTNSCVGAANETSRRSLPEALGSPSSKVAQRLPTSGRYTLYDAVQRVLEGWDRGLPRTAALLGYEPKFDLVRGRDYFTMGRSREIPGGWRVPVIVRSYKDPFRYRVASLAVLGPRGKVHIRVDELSKERVVRTFDEAVATLREFISVPIVLPALPAYILSRFSLSFTDQGPEGEIELKLDRETDLRILYGIAGFDGCGGDNAKELRVLGKRALGSSNHGFSTLIWPVKPGNLDGHYGLDGPFSMQRLLEWADEMERARRKEIRGAAGQLGC